MVIPSSHIGAMNLPGKYKAPPRRRTPKPGGSSKRWMQTERESRQRLGVRREAKRHAALDSADVSRMTSAFAQPAGNDPKRRRRCALPAHSKTWREFEALDANRTRVAPASWSAAGSEAPRRFGFCGRVAHDLCVCTAVGRRSKAPSPLRSAGALQNLADSEFVRIMESHS